MIDGAEYESSGLFRDPDVHAWVDLLTNFASLPNVRLDHIIAFEQGRVPVEIVNTVMHETMHHWCFFSPVGEVLALLKYRARHALLMNLDGREVDLMDVACDLTRYEIIEKCLGPLIEGLALFTEHDSETSGADESYCRPLHQFSIFILQELMAEEKQRLIHLFEIDNWLRRNRTRPEGVQRKADLLASPLDAAQNIYLAGYLTVKTFVHIQNRFFGGSFDKILGYLRSYFFQDYGLVDALFGDRPHDDDPVVIAQRVSEYLFTRMRALFQEDLAADVAEWEKGEDPEMPLAEGSYEDVEVGQGVTYRLARRPARGIAVSPGAEANGFFWHRELLKVFDTRGESVLLEGHKLRGLREFICRRLMPICSERVRAHAADGFVEALDETGRLLDRMPRIADFGGEQEAVINFFFVPNESALLGAIFVNGAAVAFSLRGKSRTDFGAFIRSLEPTAEQLHAVESAKKLDIDLAKNGLMSYKLLVEHVERQLPEIKNSLYRPPVSFRICAPDFDWRKTLSQLDELGLMAVLDTKRQLLDIALLSLLASRPKTATELGKQFHAVGRDLDAVLALIERLRNEFGLDLIDTTEKGEIFCNI